jgi:quercetin dioxygenase-like cupin family protein
MHITRLSDLPFHGMSRRFEGAEHGSVAMSAYHAEAPPGRGSVLHTHPYDTIAFVQAGSGTWSVDGLERDVTAGDIVVVKAGEKHLFTNTGGEPLVVVDIHLGPRIEQTNV